MIKRSVLFAAAFAALSFVGTSAQAAFTYSTSSTVVPSTANGSLVTVTDVASMMTTTSAATPNVFVTVTNLPTADFNFTLTTNYLVNGVQAATLTTQYSVSASLGTFSAGAQSLTVLSTAPAGFSFITPKATDGTINGTSASTSLRIVQTAAVPEPASVALVGLGLAGVGGLALRRRTK